MRGDVARDPINPAKSFTLGRIPDTLGRHEEARVQFYRSDIFATYGRWFNAVWRKDYAEAARIADRDFGNETLRDTEASRLKASNASAGRGRRLRLTDYAISPAS